MIDQNHQTVSPASEAALTPAPETTQSPATAGAVSSPASATPDDLKAKAASTNAIEVEEISFAAPKGFESYQSDFDAYGASMNTWLKENPAATAADALKYAAEWQAKRATDAQGSAVEQMNQQLDAWETDLRTDPNFSGEKYDASVAQAIKAIDAYGSPELKSVLSETGLGSHPAMVKFAFNAAKALKDADVVVANSAAPRKSFADALYGSNK